MNRSEFGSTSTCSCMRLFLLIVLNSWCWMHIRIGEYALQFLNASQRTSSAFNIKWSRTENRPPLLCNRNSAFCCIRMSALLKIWIYMSWLITKAFKSIYIFEYLIGQLRLNELCIRFPTFFLFYSTIPHVSTERWTLISLSIDQLILHAWHA